MYEHLHIEVIVVTFHVVRCAILLLAIHATVGCVAVLDQPLEPVKPSIDFDPTLYRELARQDSADGVFVGKVKAIHIVQIEEQPFLQAEIEPFPAAGTNALHLWCDPEQVSGLSARTGELTLFFRQKIPGALCFPCGSEITGFFPFDDRHKMVLGWLNGEFAEYTLFDPAAPNKLPTGLEAEFVLTKSAFVMVRFTNKGRSPISLWVPDNSAICCAWDNIRIVDTTGRVVWCPKIQLGNPIGIVQDKTTTLRPGESTYFETYFEPQRGGVYLCEYTYDSRECGDRGTNSAIRAEIVVHGKIVIPRR